jgi:hypothetical protein
MKARRVVAWIELCVAAILTLVSAASAWEVFVAPADPHRVGYGEVAWLALLLETPLAVSFWICAVALLRGWRRRWLFHILPVAVIAACCSPLWLRYAV